MKLLGVVRSHLNDADEEDGASEVSRYFEAGCERRYNKYNAINIIDPNTIPAMITAVFGQVPNGPKLILFDFAPVVKSLQNCSFVHVSPYIVTASVGCVDGIVT